MKRAWVYILQCSDNSYYTGCTTNLEKRLTQHNEARYDSYTSARLPIKLLWHLEFVDVRDAIVLERKIKKWTRKKKEALMMGDFDLLHELARSTYAKMKSDYPEREIPTKSRESRSTIPLGRMIYTNNLYRG